MATHPFRIVNVFCQSGGAPLPGNLSGNPLCVFEDAAGLDSEVMQALARQFNLSETTFILPSTRAAARVRIFTPQYEMPFAGHPTLGSAHVCRALGLGGDALTLEMQAGVIGVRAQQDVWTLRAPASTYRPCDTPRAQLALALGLTASDLDAPALWVKAGKEQLIVPLASVEAVRRTAPLAAALLDIKSEDGHSMAYVFAFDTPTRTVARFFFSLGNAIFEDPATGSATANFGGWCLATARALPLKIHISQGEAVQRPSTLLLEVDTERSVHVAGSVLEIGRGSITL